MLLQVWRVLRCIYGVIAVNLAVEILGHGVNLAVYGVLPNSVVLAIWFLPSILTVSKWTW
jgi:hypothetical protein